MENGQGVYVQMDKNTVSAKDQLKESNCVRFHHMGGDGTRVMLVGNSITLHGIKHEIGWHNEWGMAASAEEKDYVHLLERTVLEKDPAAAFCVCQASAWEVEYRHGSDVLPLYYGEARRFAPDVIVFRCIENCPRQDFDETTFLTELDKLLAYLNADGHAHIIITTGFWQHPGNDALRAYAAERGYPMVELSDLGEIDEMKALGLFEHEGVANHPGDAGMQTIADRIAPHLLSTLQQ